MQIYNEQGHDDQTKIKNVQFGKNGKPESGIELNRVFKKIIILKKSW